MIIKSNKVDNPWEFRMLISVYVYWSLLNVLSISSRESYLVVWNSKLFLLWLSLLHSLRLCLTFLSNERSQISDRMVDTSVAFLNRKWNLHLTKSMQRNLLGCWKEKQMDQCVLNVLPIVTIIDRVLCIHTGMIFSVY